MTTDPHASAESPGENRSPATGPGATTRPSAGPTASPTAGQGEIPQSIGKYRIERRLGEGGMGTVYLAIDTELKRHVALKLLRQERAGNPTLVKRFQAEAKTAAALKHKNVVAVYEAGQVDSFTFIAMEFVDGIDVHDLVQRREVIPVRRSINIIKQVASALQHAYERGVVHRDIKPSNLLIQRDGTVKLADLGLARIIDESSDAGITRDGTTVGTVDYMSPEQARNSRSADTRSDIYSLGCAWFHMLTGEPPYADGGLTQRLRLHAEGKPPDPRDLNPKVPEGIVAILNRMMAKNPDDRYRTPAEVIKELDKVSLQRSTVAGQILSDLDEPEESDGKPAIKVRKSAIPLPSRDPKLGKPESQGTVVFPMRLVGTVLAGIAVLALLLYGWSNWMPSSSEEPVDIDFTGDPLDDRDPFELQNAPEVDPNEKLENEDKQNPPPDGAQAAPAEDPSAIALTPADSDPVVQGEPKTVTPIERALAQKPYLPDWAMRSTITARRKGLVTATVALPSTIGPNARPPTIPLKPHLDKLPAAGGILLLPTAGPYELNLAQLQNHQHIVIKGGTPRPAVFIRQPAGQPIALDVSLPILEFDGLDLFFHVADETAPQPAVAMHAGTGELLLRDCSVQVLGNQQANIVALQIEKPATAALSATTRLLLDRSVLMGPHLTAVQVDSDHADIVIRDSLIVSGSAPALQIAQSRATAAKSQRWLRLIGDTIVSRSHAVELLNGLSIGDVAPAQITAIDTVFANTAAVESAAMLGLRNWPSTAGQLQNLTWESTGSAYQGWPRLVQNRNAKITEGIAADFTDWKSLWPVPGEEPQFHPTPWPTSAVGFSQPLDLKPFASQTLPNTVAVSLLGDQPGCRVANLHVGTATLPTQTRDIPPRPSFPNAVAAEFKNAERIPLDLTKRDLGSFLRKTRLPPRVVIVAEGYGRREITPFSITDRAVRIEFRQKGGEVPLKLVAAAKSRGSVNKPANDALMTVLSGRLEIVGGDFEMSASANRPGFDWFLDVRDGGFSIEKCHLAVRSINSARNPGLIHWQDDTTGASATQSRIGLIRDSFLVAGGTLIQAQMRQRQLFVNNAILVSPETIFSLDVDVSPAIPPSSLVLQNSTLSAARNFFEVSTANPHDSRRAALGIFAERTIFAAPTHTDSEAATPVVFADRSAVAGGPVAWIGEQNGYSDEIKNFVVADPGNLSDTSNFNLGWIETWGQDNVRSPLTKPGGVLFAAPLPTLEELVPQHFTLHGSAEANAWEGQRLGADPTQIVPQTSVKPNSSSKRTKSNGF
ncbi:Serine/threonine-protein kinase PknB [Symmachiella macrocystis]|uniref:Serine/threonine-protein kinase PknB n=1 Tax=Symmachiella macrocystis TaxID=2527985 RepID=A0A5C6BL94_9PLAN|nr:serine/threonine-protein kinase [Symmachiella macrocystis]TWU11899.1 Serine/threonine-protein kinase PknB [Symmachiella macrocystis]